MGGQVEMVGECSKKKLGEKEYHCFFELALHVIGGKWKPVIVYKLATEGVLRFGELRRSIPRITERMLTRQLRELERDRIVYRKVYHQVPPKVEYSLQTFGIQLIPILIEMREWGKAYELEIGDGVLHGGDGAERPDTPEISVLYREQLSAWST